MPRKNKRPVFGEDDSESESTGDGFKAYLSKKSLQSSKRAKSPQALAVAKSSLDEDESKGLKRPQETEQRSSFMEGLLKAKRQREMDRLHSQAIRNTFENELQKKNDSPDQSFITEGYKVKRTEYDQAELRAAEEDEYHNDDKLHGGSSRALALQMLMRDAPPAEDSEAAPEEACSEKNVAKVPPIFENDIYHSEPSKMRRSVVEANHSVESLIKLRPEEKQSCIREFLRSTKSMQEIKLHIEKYYERQSVRKR
ncbi:hypothetical protein HG536_0F04020 [Torulaspora globosa]|uniref:Nuclear speckle splicing regulatory protein 1 N-terminal domain-containing protein n=1 Tax=Torulaspora globosa TaxID=48254 RepID=A0A7G3ZKP1_9SACH|nr:uncharacterized protein HG536_0F04020 [Torulaspora globosa]QLL34077.1 hypothetical protein HG536_0F04020 [Torulaspora globosa]